MKKPTTKITHAFGDGDPIVYKACFSKQKTSYKWINELSGDESEVYPNAKAAQVFYTSLELLEETEGWERKSYKEVPNLQEVYGAVDGVLKDYMDTAAMLTGNDHLKWLIYLTPSGRKSKDREGLEVRYQDNRDPSQKPMYLKEAREYLVASHDFIKYCPDGYEADAPLVAKAERKGDKAVLSYIDKDLSQARNCHHINMYESNKKLRKMFKSTSLGWLTLGDHDKDAKGCGDMFVAYQTMAGDSADHYKGLAGYGAKTAYKLLKDCKSQQELMDVLYKTYRKKYPEGIKYTSWDGQEISLTAYELLEQHYNLPYMERKPNDYFKLDKYLKDLDK